MTQIRNNLATLFAVLAVFFILTIIFDWGLDLGGRRGRGNGTGEVLGKVNGKEISYREFSELIRRASENQKRQSGGEIDDETERQLRSQVWNQIVEELLVDQEIDRLGIKVTDQEIIDIVQGPNPPEFLVAQFRDSTGTFRREAYNRAMMDPQNKQAWVQVEDALRQDQKRKKLQSLLTASVRVSEGEILQRFIDRNVTMDAEFALFDVNRMIPDSTVTPTDEEVRRYYDSHPEEYKVKAARKVKFVLFSQIANAEDSVAVENEISRFQDQVKSGLDFVELAKTYSEIPAQEAFFKHGELGKTKENAVFSAKKGSIVGPIKDFDGYHLIKILDERQGKDEFVKASHILLNVVSGPESVKVIQKARDLARRARSGEDFAKLARENSQDFGSGSQGGELGWNGKGGWVKPFEDAAFKARVGEIVGPIRSQFGWHIIKVTGRDRREVKIADLAMKVKASPQTIDAAYQRAQDFAFLAKDEGFEKSAGLSSYSVRETPEFTKGGVIPGIGMNDAISNFAFDRKVGSISEPIAATGGSVVVMVSGAHEDGVRNFDEVKVLSRMGALKEKKLRAIRPQVDEFYKKLTPASDLLAAAQAVPNVAAQKTGPFKPVDFPQGVGRDPKFIGVALSLKPGELSKPFEGSRGYYVMKLLSRSSLDSASLASQRQSIKDQILQEKRTRVIADWRTEIRDKAEIEDHRDKFFVR
ncbi:MAG: peptidylprolyl isomerase [Bacteroidota bacterium]